MRYGKVYNNDLGKVLYLCSDYYYYDLKKKQ